MSGRPKTTDKRVQIRVSNELHARICNISPRGEFSDGVRIAAEAYGTTIDTLRGYNVAGAPVGEWKANKT